MFLVILLGGLGLAGVVAATLLKDVRRKKQPTNPQEPTDNGEKSVEKVQSDIILNSVDDGVVVINPEGTIQLFNPAACRLTGWPEGATGLSYSSVLHFADEKNQVYTENNDPFKRVLTEKKSIRDDKAFLISKSKKSIPINLSASPLLDEEENITGVVAIFRDVTEEREKERQRAEFISTASHEMRSPVAAIEGYLALAMNDKVSTIDSRARNYLLKAHESTQHLGQLFQDLLTSSHAEDGRISNHPTLVEMSDFLGKLTEDLRFTAQKKNLSVEYIVGTNGNTISPDEEGHRRVVQPLFYAHVDPERLREVITNLFDNAVKYTETGKISIGITGDDKVIQMYVKDTGAGIPAEDVPHLFQKFYRIDNSATRTINGTGLGLFISRKIVELYQGRIWVESKLGEGSTFFINLPRLSNEKVEELKKNPSGQPQVIAPQAPPQQS